MRARKRQWIVFSVLALIPLTGCAKRPVTGTAAVPSPTGAAVAAGATPSSPKVDQAPPAMVQAPSAPATATSPSPARPSPSEFAAVPQLHDVHFDFDKYDIRPGDATILDANAMWLRTNPGQLILIEGHCDDRGTNEYNLVLGERRARATLNYLVSHGVQASRVTIISYGEDRPLCTDHHESCWSKNRRAHFLVKPG
jgi:peptidoglycan-associated lipoprotein